MSDFKLDNMHFDVLKEIGNIGAGNAVTSLSKMLNRKVDMAVPNVSLVEFKNVSNFIGGPETIVAGILVNLSGYINGIMMFLTDEKNCRPLVKELFSETGLVIEGEDSNEIVFSALVEVGNILAGAYLSSLADMISQKIVASAPSLCIDMGQAILSVPAIEFGKVSDEVLFIESVFATSSMDISGYFLLVPDFESFKILFSSLGV